MCKIQSLKVFLLGLLCSLAIPSALAQVQCVTCPANAQATAVGAGITVTRANGSIVQPGQTVGACEVLNVLASVAYQPNVLVFNPGPPPTFTQVVGSGFFGGTGSISVNNGNPLSPFNVTPADMATTTVGPATCADTEIKGMNNLPYTITAADIAAGSVTFTFNYQNGHSLLGDCSLLVGANNQFIVSIAPLPTCSIAPATQTICDGATATFTASSTGAGATFTWT